MDWFHNKVSAIRYKIVVFLQCENRRREGKSEMKDRSTSRDGLEEDLGRTDFSLAFTDGLQVRDAGGAGRRPACY